MCGIVGVISPRNATSIVERMLETITHRGPDGKGIWSCQASEAYQLTFGHRRLSILDLSDNASQPMVDSTGQFALTYNGEIYNYLEIQAELAREGVIFRSQSDTEVLLEAYKRWGTSCLSKFNGMFAFALYDKPRGRIFCARDRYGEKPFLYSFQNDLFVFASEYKSLLQHSEIPIDIDEWRLMQGAVRLSSGLDSDRQTVFTAIHQLLPSESMVVNVNTLEHSVSRYWKIEPGVARKIVNERDVFVEFRELLTDAIRLRLRSDVPVGSCLSGGLDSSAITCIAKQLLGANDEYNTFTGRFPGSAVDEWHYAEQVVDATGVRSHIVEPTVEGFMADLPKFIWHNELPVGSSSQFAQWSVFKLARKYGVTVLLDGQGADEGLGGYEGYFQDYLKALHECGDIDRYDSELPLIQKRYPLVFSKPFRAWRDQIPFPFRHRLYGWLNQGTGLIYGLDHSIIDKLQEDTAQPVTLGFNSLSNTLLQNSFGRFLTTLLRYGDRNSMAHSLEVRLPFCDYRIAEFVHRLPPHLLMGEVQNKRLLRESMRGIIPEGVRTRWNKQGFVPPQADWFRSKDFMVLVRDIIGSDNFRQNPFWRHSWWDKALDRLEKGERGLSNAVWRVFIQECWKKMFLERMLQTRREISLTR